VRYQGPLFAKLHSRMPICPKMVMYSLNAWSMVVAVSLGLMRLAGDWRIDVGSTRPLQHTFRSRKAGGCLGPAKLMNMTSKTMPEFRKRGNRWVHSLLNVLLFARHRQYPRLSNTSLEIMVRASGHHGSFLKEICRIRYVQLLGCNPIRSGGETRITCLNTHH